MPLTEAEAVAGPAVFAEWLAAQGVAPRTTAERLAAIGAFAGLEPRLGWAGNLRRRTSYRIAIRRGARAWSYRALATDEASWREAAGARAHGHFEELLRAVADHVLCADTRPDDTLSWHGDPTDPWPYGALVVGATLILSPRAADLGAR